MSTQLINHNLAMLVRTFYLSVHHIICRGIERQNIFKDNTDRNRFLERLGSVLQKTSTPCYGWALIPNHFLC
jgi:hypothetical protein